MNHVVRDLDATLAADEYDATPVALFHSRQIRTRQSHAAHHVDVKEALPFAIVDFLECLAFEYAEVVDQDVNGGEAPRQRFRRSGGGEIAGKAIKFSAGCDGSNTL